MKHPVSPAHLEAFMDITNRITHLQRQSEGSRTPEQQRTIKELQKWRNKMKEDYAKSYRKLITGFTVRVMRKSNRKGVKPRRIGYGKIIRPVFYQKGGYVSYEVEWIDGIAYRHTDPLHFIKHTTGPLPNHSISGRPKRGRR